MSKCAFCGEKPEEALKELARIFGHDGYCRKCAWVHLGEVIKIKDHSVVDEIPGIGPTCGVEAEFNPSIDTLAKIVSTGAANLREDNSLRGKSIEVVSPILHESNYEQWIDHVFSGAKATLYRRCGVHYWLQTSHMGWFGLNANMVYWNSRIAYRFLDSVIPPYRLPGDYDQSGKPMSMHKWKPILYGNKCDFIRSIYGDCGWLLRTPPPDRQSLMKGHKRANDKGDQTFMRGPVCRYWWMNVHGHFRFGATEIRIHPGTVRPETMKNTIKSWRIWLDTFSNPKMHKYSPYDVLPRYLSNYWRGVEQIVSAGLPGGVASDVM